MRFLPYAFELLSAFNLECTVASFRLPEAALRALAWGGQIVGAEGGIRMNMPPKKDARAIPIYTVAKRLLNGF